jgi:MoxR-like ATPase
MCAHKQLEPREKMFKLLTAVRQRYHDAPLEDVLGRTIPKNLVFMALSYILKRNHVLVGEPGWGKSTVSKIMASAMSGLPYDIYDALEMRGHPGKYEEKVVGRFDYGKLGKEGVERTIWQGGIALPVLVIDEINRFSLDAQEAILQGKDTGRWNYNNSSLYLGKKPTFSTMNQKGENGHNGMLPALLDRQDLITEERYYTNMNHETYNLMKTAVEQDLCSPEHTKKVLEALSKDFNEFTRLISSSRIVRARIEVEGRYEPVEPISDDEYRHIITEIDGVDVSNDAKLFLQAFMAEINYSNRYGCKRETDPISDDTHDRNYAGVSVHSSFSPRSVMAAEQYSKGLAWFLGDTLALDHVRTMIPYVFALKAGFTDDYRNAHGADERTDLEILHLAKKLVADVYDRYAKSIQPVKNLIAKIQKTMAEPEYELLTEGQRKSRELLTKKEIDDMKPEDHDHPLMKDFIMAMKSVFKGERAFYE